MRNALDLVAIGFFAAMALVNVIQGGLTRSIASVWYAGLMLVMTGIEIYSLPRTGGGFFHALLITAYVGTTVGFSFALLRTWQYDRVMGQVTLWILAVNVPLIWLEEFVKAWQPFYAIDQLALDALLVALLVVGVRAIKREGFAIAGTYLIAFVVPAVGTIVNDLAHHGFFPLGFEWALFAGMAWEAALLAFAVAFRNRGIQNERDRFERLATLDGLTGVANRRTFDETLQRMWNVAWRAKVPVAVAMIDIDHFKRLNDTRGHQVGDECLRRVAALCSSVLRRAGDCFARYGGEEFAAILVNIDLNHAIAIAESMRRTVERDGGITVSIGVAARVPDTSDSPNIIVTDADRALYRAKHEGRNCVRVAELATTEVG